MSNKYFSKDLEIINLKKKLDLGNKCILTNSAYLESICNKKLYNLYQLG